MGFCLTSDVSLNGLNLNTVDDEGVTWLLDDLDGWWTLPDSSIPDDPRPTEYEGSYDMDGRYLPRLLTVKGRFILPSDIPVGPTVVKARRKILGASDLVRRVGTLRVDEGPSLQSYVRLSGTPSINTVSKNGTTEFEVGLRAADPRKYTVETSQVSIGLAGLTSGRTYDKDFDYAYSSVVDVGSVVTAFNSGTYNTGANIRLYGPVENPGIEHIESGKELKFNITLERNQYIDIDLMEHSVLLMGTSNRRYLMTNTSSWFLLNTGDNNLRYTGTPTGDSNDIVDKFPGIDEFDEISYFPVLQEAEMTITYRSAWI